MSTNPVKVTIAYCSECGYEPQTLALAEALMRTFGHELGEIKLIPWFDGSFEVSVNGELVHSMYRDGGFPEDSTIVQAVRRHQAADTPVRPSEAAGQAD
jgi:selenoprotein W-related protein